MKVTAPPDILIGTIEEEWSIWKPQFNVKDAEGNIVLCIEGPRRYSLCMGDNDFKVN